MDGKDFAVQGSSVLTEKDGTAVVALDGNGRNQENGGGQHKEDRGKDNIHETLCQSLLKGKTDVAIQK